MNKTYTWGIIVLVLIIAGGVIWYEMNKPVAVELDALGNPVKTQTTTGTTHTTTGTQGTSNSGTTGTTDIRPKITSISPAQGKVGDIAQITGVNFDATTNVITFGPSKGLHKPDGTPDNQVASIGAANGTVLSFKVPTAIESGMLCDQSNKCATYGPSATKPGVYEVTVVNKNGLSNTYSYTVTN